MATSGISHGGNAGQFLASTFTLLVIAWICFLLRAYCRLVLVRKAFAEDYFITFGMVALTCFAAMVPVQTNHGGGHHLANIPNPTENIPKWGEAFFVAEIMYLLTLWAVKISVILLLLRFAVSKAMVWVLRGTAALTTVLTLAFTFWITFQCHPVQSQWDPSIPGDCASPEAYVNSVYLLSAISAATDIITAATPVFIISRLDIDRRSKLLAGLTLAIGSLACVATIVRFPFIHDFAVSEDVTYAMVPLSIASFVEVSLGCICASLATLRPLFQKWGHIYRTNISRGSAGETYNSMRSAESMDVVELTSQSEKDLPIEKRTENAV